MVEISSATKSLLSISMLKGVGPAALKKVVGFPNFSEMKIQELADHVPQIARAIQDATNWSTAQDLAAMQLRMSAQHGARILSPLDSEFPSLLALTKDAPYILYVKGSLSKSPERSVAIIGTREPTLNGGRVATRITRFFAEKGWSIVSGLAIGCDSIAHQAALDAGAHTVAVLAHGLHMIAPSRNKQLADDILSSGGALVSEFPFGQAVQKQQYVIRDRTQAGMAQGVVMIQSDVAGGSLHASRAALDYDRWLAVPFPTELDLANNEPKIQANLIIADGVDNERSQLLRCPVKSLKRVIVLKSREDYGRMTGSDLGENSNAYPSFENQPDDFWLIRNIVSEDSSSVRYDLHAQSTARDDFLSESDVANQIAIDEPAPGYQESLSQEASSENRILIRRKQKIPLKIVHLPVLNAERRGTKLNTSTRHEFESEISARVEYLRFQLSIFQKIYSPGEGKQEKKDRLIAQYSAQDMLTQMTKIKSLLDADNGHHRIGPEHNKDENRSKREAEEKVTLSLFSEEISDNSMSDILSCLSDGNVNSIRFDDEPEGALGLEDDCSTRAGKVDVYFDDLLTAINKSLENFFNDLADQELPYQGGEKIHSNRPNDEVIS